jgi:hypothetical protein
MVRPRASDASVGILLDILRCPDYRKCLSVRDPLLTSAQKELTDLDGGV